MLTTQRPNQSHTVKKRISLVVLCAVLLPVVGCGRKATVVSGSTFSVDGRTGTATGQAFGIEFTVAGASGTEITSQTGGASTSSNRTEIILAGDAKIRLEMENEGKSVVFHLNGRHLGSLAQGDKVEITKDRHVTVNGKERAPADTAN